MIIRKATIHDAPQIATLLLLAMEEIIYTFIGEANQQKAHELLLYFAGKEQNQYSYQNCFIAETGNTIVAAANVYNGGELHQLRKPVVDHIHQHYNKNFIPEDETQPGEFYIDSIGVSPSQQGKGIGATLLQFLINEYTVKQGHTLGLLVETTNPNAKRLYTRLGFTTTGHKNIFGKTLEHLQIKKFA